MRGAHTCDRGDENNSDHGAHGGLVDHGGHDDCCDHGDHDECGDLVDLVGHPGDHGDEEDCNHDAEISLFISFFSFFPFSV